MLRFKTRQASLDYFVFFNRLKRVLVGEPLANHASSHELLPKWKALSVLASDALSSVAYATEEVLIPLVAFSSLAAAWSIPLALTVAGLLLILTVSYCQTIDAYPNGGGAYIVAKENLGNSAGLIAAASLLLDYVLTVAVSIASGVDNLGSAFPWILAHREGVGSSIIFFMMVFNLRGVKESAALFALPTYFFIASFCILIGAGLWQWITGQIQPPATLITHPLYPAVPLFLLLRAFSSGCSALTGVEAISNGIPLFQAPAQKNAKITLCWMSLILGVFFLGITLLSRAHGILPQAGQTGISSLAEAVLGRGIFHYILQSSTAMILILAANTSYADFPRLSSLLAKDRFLPRQLASVGDRLVFSNGIIGLSGTAILLLILFKGETHHLIPLYSVGVFLSFTLSQSGMVIHHLKKREKGWVRACGFNLLGAFTTFVILCVITITKFLNGAWLVILCIPIMFFIFTRIHRHYLAVGKELSLLGEKPPADLKKIQHTVIIPVSGIHRGVVEALSYALSISDDIRACYVELDEKAAERVQNEWKKWAPEIPLVILQSPFRSILSPLLSYFDAVQQSSGHRVITVVIPEFVTLKWRHQILHNQTAWMLRAALLFKPGQVITTVRYHLQST